jgi:hypothetical protein
MQLLSVAIAPRGIASTFCARSHLGSLGPINELTREAGPLSRFAVPRRIHLENMRQLVPGVVASSVGGEWPDPLVLKWWTTRVRRAFADFYQRR